MPLYDETETAFERRGSILIVRIFGSIEFFCVESLRKDIEFALNSERTETIVVSFADVALVDSSGLGLFLELQKRMTGSCELRLCDMSPNVRAIFQYSRIFSHFDIDHSLAATLASLGVAP
ncbi:MAG: STAS domain-containing protein [Rectinemataceae bacterium]